MRGERGAKDKGSVSSGKIGNGDSNDNILLTLLFIHSSIHSFIHSFTLTLNQAIIRL